MTLSELNSRWQQSLGFRLLQWVVLAVFVAFLLSFIPVYSTTHYTCLHCRAHKHERRFLGIPRARVTDTAFSPWFRTHYPPHEHSWEWSGGTKLYTVFGTVIFACGHRHPIFTVDPSTQLRLAKRAPEEFRSFYSAMTSAGKAEQERAAETALLRAIELQ